MKGIERLNLSNVLHQDGLRAVACLWAFTKDRIPRWRNPTSHEDIYNDDINIDEYFRKEAKDDELNTVTEGRRW